MKSDASQGGNRPPEVDDGPSLGGECNCASAGRYREEVAQFVLEADIDALARDAAPRLAQERGERERAERDGRARARDRGRDGPGATA
jgi:hypothetical protein